ncbi:MAG: c-type cytochrome [Acetobacteraceae bacterium]
MKHGAIAWLSVLLCTFCVPAAHAGNNGQAFAQIARGRYLTIAGDCAACHTAPGGKPFAGGKPIETPFGVVVSANITPDRETGIGAWTDAEFLGALRRGIGRGGDHLYPAMPYPYYTKLSRADVLAIRAYLNTLAPVRNEVKSDRLPFPFDIRASMVAWNTLFFSDGRFRPAADKSAAWNRGAYLVALEHCGACHTSKNLLGGDETGMALQGGAVQGWFAPDVTDGAHTGLGTWSVADIVAYLHSGHNAVSAATGPMAEVVRDSTSHLTGTDLKAIALYLKDQPGANRKPPKPASAGAPDMKSGQALYVDNCSACHGASGQGIPGLFPALKDNPSVQARRPTSLIRVVLGGAQSVATASAPTGAAMPAFGWKLSNAEVAAIVTYIRNTWGNAASTVSAGTVGSARQRLSQRVD